MTLLFLRLMKIASCTLVVTAAGLAGTAAGCSNQGEGDRCSSFPSPDASVNGTDECQEGLVCTPAAMAGNTTLYPYDRCCPRDLQNHDNVPACYSVGNVGGMPDAMPGEGGAEGSTSEASTEASSDAPADAAKDGGKDAPSGDAHPDAKLKPDAKAD